MTASHPRITIEADKRDGKPCIRGMRITVNDVLGWLAHGMTEEEILDEHPGLEKEDFAAVYAFRGRCGGSRLRSSLGSAYPSVRMIGSQSELTPLPRIAARVWSLLRPAGVLTFAAWRSSLTAVLSRWKMRGHLF